ncbi:hypothetical protein [Chryseobacterium gwangjuense]|uniref:hypothetical protein n=1 Tax=Chryseobacterium gwangjuense TaxID=1069980 RepID=UPI001E36E16D|nr:hypothetical protein [Chryseobacterium gwangjuense]MCE3074663.1 hypothetical protein [Chryseobacterium gwangjuense]
MNKTVNGCLFLAIATILIVFMSAFFIIKNVENTFLSDKSKVDTSWNNYIKLLHKRNENLFNNKNLKNITPLINKTEELIKTRHKKEELLSNEYVLNDSLTRIKSIRVINQKLNDYLYLYNANVKEFNIKYSAIPYSYIRKNYKVELYDYFKIDYGRDNKSLIREQKKIDDWIENGGELK